LSVVFIKQVTNYYYLDSRSPEDVIYLDFQKFFDKVSHHRLALKREAHKVSRNVLRWFGCVKENRERFSTPDI